MKCVKHCDFMGVVRDGYVCKFHDNKPLTVDDNGFVHRCINCERHFYYNRLVDDVKELIDDYNEYVSHMDKKIDDLHILLEMVRKKI